MVREPASGDVHALAGAYALDALDDLERARFVRHAAACEVCAADLAEMRETVARLAAVNWSVPPPRMRTAVLDQVARTRQDGRRHREDAGPALAARWRRRTAIAVAASILTAGGGVAVWSLTHQRVREEQAAVAQERDRSRRVAEILAAPDARLTHRGGVSIVVSPSHNAGVVVLSDLPDPGQGRAYELWMIGAAGPTSVGLLAAGQRSATVLVDRVAGATTFGLSREPAGGSPLPTDVVQTVPLA